MSSDSCCGSTVTPARAARPHAWLPTTGPAARAGRLRRQRYPLLGGLDDLPVRLNVRSRWRLGGTEHMRVTADQLGHDVSRHVIDRPRSVWVLLGDARVERDLEQQVAQLLAQVIAVSDLDGPTASLRLFDRNGTALRRLLGIPGAAAGRAQPVHDATTSTSRAPGRRTTPARSRARRRVPRTSRVARRAPHQDPDRRRAIRARRPAPERAGDELARERPGGAPSWRFRRRVGTAAACDPR